MKKYGILFKVVSQSVILFGLKMWVIPPHLLRALGSFYNWVARRLTDRKPRQQPDTSWVYPNVDYAMEYSVLFPIKDYIKQWNNMMSQ